MPALSDCCTHSSNPMTTSPIPRHLAHHSSAPNYFENGTVAGCQGNAGDVYNECLWKITGEGWESAEEKPWRPLSSHCRCTAHPQLNGTVAARLLAVPRPGGQYWNCNVCVPNITEPVPPLAPRPPRWVQASSGITRQGIVVGWKERPRLHSYNAGSLGNRSMRWTFLYDQSYPWLTCHPLPIQTWCPAQAECTTVSPGAVSAHWPQHTWQLEAASAQVLCLACLSARAFVLDLGCQFALPLPRRHTSHLHCSRLPCRLLYTTAIYDSAEPLTFQRATTSCHHTQAAPPGRALPARAGLPILRLPAPKPAQHALRPRVCELHHSPTHAGRLAARLTLLHAPAPSLQPGRVLLPP